jgi:hypothetical protein
MPINTYRPVRNRLHKGGPGKRPNKKRFARPLRSLFLPPRTRFVGFSGVIFFFLTGVGIPSQYVDLETVQSQTIFFDVEPRKFVFSFSRSHITNFFRPALSTKKPPPDGKRCRDFHHTGRILFDNS